MQESITKKIAIVILFDALLIWIAASFFKYGNTGQGSTLERITFLVNGLCMALMLARAWRNHPFSLDMVHSLFCIIFLWYAPIIQISGGYHVWGISYTPGDIARTNALIFLWLLFYNGGFWLFGKRKKPEKEKHAAPGFDEIPETYVLGLLVICVAITAVYLKKYGLRFGGFGTDNVLIDISSKSLSILVDHCVTALVVFSVIYILNWTGARNEKKIFGVIAVICLLLCCSPFSISRYAAGSIYSCLLITLFPSLRKNHRFAVLFICALVLVFPVLGLFRFETVGDVSSNEIINIITKIKDYYKTANYDTYQMLIATCQATDKCGFTYGRQLLGTLLFFVPRSIWPGKPVGTGAYVSKLLNFSFSNVSAPMVAESYIDFGVAGVIVFAVIAGVAVARIDASFWDKGFEKNNAGIKIGYIYFAAYFMFLCRGSLQSTFSYLIAYFAMLLLVAGTGKYLARMNEQKNSQRWRKI